MGEIKRSLVSLHPRAADIPIAMALSAFFLAAGLYMPVITIKQFGLWTDTFSVITGIRTLWLEHQRLLAIIVFLFSIVFPVTKLACLSAIWFGRFTDKQRASILEWLSRLGKWSMLDVFIVALTIVIAKISKFADAEARPGIYVFAVSIALAIVAGMRVESVAKPVLKKTA